MKRFFTTPKEDAAVNIDVCSEDATVHVCASAFASRKRQLMEKHVPGRPKKKLRGEDWRQKWYDAAESESYSSIGVWEPYEAEIINYHTADENSRVPILTEKISRNIPVLIITVGHQPFPVQLAHAANQCSFHADKMADQKPNGSLGVSSSCSKRSKRQVTVATCEKWQREFDRDYQTLLWLQCDVDTANRSLIDTLWCDVCRTYQTKIQYKRNFSAIWVTGSTNHKSSNIVDHSKSEQHIACMAYIYTDSATAQDEPVESYAPIARSLLRMDDSEKEKLKRKFEICYILAEEGITFFKYPTFHALAESQGVDIGSSYKGADCAKTFTHFIAESQQ